MSAVAVDREWLTQYELLLEYKKACGDTNVPDDGTHLHRWVQQQHRHYTSFLDILEGDLAATTTDMTFDKLRLLFQAGFVFQRVLLNNNNNNKEDNKAGKKKKKNSEDDDDEEEAAAVDKVQLRFDTNCENLKKFRDRFGHVEVPHSSKTLASMMDIELPPDMQGNNNNNKGKAKQQQNKKGGEDDGKSDAEGPEEENKVDDPEGGDDEDDEGGGDNSGEKENTKPEVDELRQFCRLGQWLASIRSRMRRNMRKNGNNNNTGPVYDTYLTPARFQRLDDIGIKTTVSRGWKKKRKLEAAAEDASSPARKRKPPLSKEAKAARQKQLQENWDARFEEMKQFVEEHGHFIVPCNKPHYKLLRRWMDQQRTDYKNMQNGDGIGQLTAERLGRLTSIKFEFHSSQQRRTFDERFDEWVKYRETHGKEPCQDEYGIGKWVCKIRSKKVALDEGKKSNLTQEQIDRLNAQGFVWKVVCNNRPTSGVRKSFEERLKELLAFKAQHGHTSVPQNTPGLGDWVHKQRSRYSMAIQGKRCGLSKEKIDMLNAVGFEWAARHRSPHTGGRRRPGRPKRDREEEETEDEEEDDDMEELDDEEPEEEEDDNDNDPLRGTLYQRQLQQRQQQPPPPPLDDVMPIGVAQPPLHHHHHHGRAADVVPLHVFVPQVAAAAAPAVRSPPPYRTPLPAHAPPHHPPPNHVPQFQFW